MKATHVAEHRKGYWRRVLRPLYWWLLLVLVLYGYRLHERMMEETRLHFSVIPPGKAAAFEVSVWLDGKPLESGQKLSLGRHTFSVTHPKGVTFATNFFGWYGGRDWGQIRLERMMGTLNLSASPAATITLTGPECSLTFHHLTATNLTLPTDEYVVRAEYPHWSQAQNIAISANQSSVCTFAPKLGAVALACNKEGATYRLKSAEGKVIDSGSLPAIVTGLPTGAYAAIIRFHQEERQQRVLVEANETNEVTMTFLLGSIRIESDPSGADVRDGEGNSLGQTPLDIADVTPQTMQLTVSLDGYQSVPLSLDIAADQTNVCHTNLVSLRYLSAMKQAREALAMQAYGLVTLATKEALAVYPNDADALQLQSQAAATIKAEEDRQQRLKRPKVVFDAVCATNPDSDLFEPFELKTRQPVKEAVDAIVAALQSEPDSFKITANGSSEPDIYQVVARQSFSLGILGGTERICLLVVGQAKDDETQIWFRVLEYQVQHTIEATSLFKITDNKQVIPLHQSRMQMTDADRQRVRDGVRVVMGKIGRVMEK